MGPEELLPGLELEEPSPGVDGRILAAARHQPCRRRAVRRALLGGLLLSTSAASLLAFLVLRPHELLAPGGEGAANVAEAAPLEAIAELRQDLDQIREMAELIPTERRHEQEDIETRIQTCLDDLEKLEMELRKITGSFLLEETRGKGVNL